MVIPALGGAIMILLGDLALAAAYFVLIALFVAIVGWMIVRARDIVGSVPWAGGALVGVLNRVWDTTQSMVMGLERMEMDQLLRLYRQVRYTLNMFLAPMFWQTWGYIGALQAQVWPIVSFDIPDIRRQVGDLWHFAAEMVALTGYLFHARIEPLEQNYNRLRDFTSELAARTDYLLHGRIEPVEANFNRLRDVTSELVARTAGLEAYLPLLRALARFEAETVGGIERLGGRVAELERGEADLLRELEKILPLSIVTALGIAAVMNLERLARDPCHCLTLGDFSDLPSRVDALESIGP